MNECNPSNRRVALVVGVDEYEDPQLVTLRCAVPDATDFGAFLKYRAGYGRVEQLLSGVTDDQIVDTAVRLVKELKPGDLFLFYFSGHGIEYAGRHLLLCPKAQYGRLQFYRQTVPIDQLRDETARPGVDRVFILDACRTSPVAGRGIGGLRGEAVLRDVVTKAPMKVSGAGSFGMMCSCSEGEQAGELASRQNGLFTAALLSVLDAGVMAGKEVRLSEDLRVSVALEMAALGTVEGVWHTQNPWNQSSGPATPVLIPAGVGQKPSSPPVPSPISRPAIRESWWRKNPRCMVAVLSVLARVGHAVLCKVSRLASVVLAALGLFVLVTLLCMAILEMGETRSGVRRTPQEPHLRSSLEALQERATLIAQRQAVKDSTYSETPSPATSVPSEPDEGVVIQQSVPPSQLIAKPPSPNVEEAIRLSDTKDYANAFHAFCQASDQDLNDVDLHRRIEECARRGRLERQFLDRYRNLVEQDPGSATLHNYLGNALLMLDPQDSEGKAQDQYQAALRLDGQFSPPLMNLGIIAFRKGRHAEAEDRFNQYLQLSPQDAVGWTDLGMLHAARVEADANDQPAIEKGLFALDKAIQLDPGLASAHKGRGRIMAATGRKAEALKAYQRSLALDYEQPDVRRQFEQLAWDLGTDRVIAGGPDDLQTRSIQGAKALSIIRALDQGQFNQAEQVSRELARVDLENALVWRLLAKALDGQGHSEEAAKAGEKATRLASVAEREQ